DVLGVREVACYHANEGPLALLFPRALSLGATNGEVRAALRLASRPVSFRYKHAGQRSGAIGYLDPSGHNRYCRATPFTRDHPQEMLALEPLLLEMAAVFRQGVPERYAAQRLYWAMTSPDFRMAEPFTTGAVNLNAHFPVHVDAGDLKLGFGCFA